MPDTESLLKMTFLFPRWDMDSFPGGYVSHDPNSQDVKAAHGLDPLF